MYQRAQAHIFTCFIFMSTAGRVGIFQTSQVQGRQVLSSTDLTEKALETLVDRETREALSGFEEVSDSDWLLMYPLALPPALNLTSFPRLLSQPSQTAPQKPTF